MSEARAVLTCLTLLALGCASAPWRASTATVAPEDLLSGAPLALPHGAPSTADEAPVLAVSAAMQRFLDDHVSRGASAMTRLRQLTSAIMSEESFGLTYDETTRTASGTFHARRGNCLSFSNMFVALARRVGLKVSFQEVDTPPDWSLRNDAFVLNRHVNVFADVGTDGEHVVDFNMADFRTSYDRRVISDERALAHFHNNVAVERMQAGDVTSAFRHFRGAIHHDPSFSPAWTNLGTLYSREGHPAYAEAAYQQALEVDPHDLVAMSNLASLLERQGEGQRASRLRRRVEDHRHRNPYYRYQLARQAFDSHDYDAAIGHLRYAVRKKKTEDRFYFLLGLCHMRKGETRKAEHYLAKAKEVAATDAMKRRYADKLDILLAASPRDVRPRPE